MNTTAITLAYNTLIQLTQSDRTLYTRLVSQQMLQNRVTNAIRTQQMYRVSVTDSTPMKCFSFVALYRKRQRPHCNKSHAQVYKMVKTKITNMEPTKNPSKRSSFLLMINLSNHDRCESCLRAPF